jgi:transcriptional regulator of acetoin/glycerol metabolism
MRGILTLSCEANPDQWFSEAPEKVAKAKAGCDECPVRNDCAELGENEEFGVWGGMTPSERQEARRFRVIMLEEMNNAHIRRMHAEGNSISAMARELGIPRKTLADRLRKLTGLAA